MENKKLKKLELKKSKIIELSEIDSTQVKGGTTPSSWPCIYGSATIIGSVASAGQDQSWWACDPAPNTDVTCFELYGGCNISEINV